MKGITSSLNTFNTAIPLPAASQKHSRLANRHILFSKRLNIKIKEGRREVHIWGNLNKFDHIYRVITEVKKTIPESLC